MSSRFTGKNVIITGAGTGIGRASAIRFASEGAQVLLTGRTETTLNQTLELITAGGGKAQALVADAASEADVAAMVTHCVKVFGGLDCFFANAATWIGALSLFEQSPEQWRRVFELNVIGPFLAIKYAGQFLREQGSGSIIVTSSVAGLRANAGDAAYSASKAAVNNLVQVAANELRGSGVRVNAILPGLIETEGTQEFFAAARARGVESKIGRVNPLQRAGQPEEIAAMAAFLASADASYVNGQCYAVDGGVSSSHPFGRLA
ncbi:MAG: SDR family oxidoreductase [Gammaproteobacteria bacterium]|nr:SDR family oxidoreductase [Gammaproteobacteria bacterium]